MHNAQKETTMINTLSQRLDNLLGTAVLGVMLAGLPFAGILFVAQSVAV